MKCPICNSDLEQSYKSYLACDTAFPKHYVSMSGLERLEAYGHIIYLSHLTNETEIWNNSKMILTINKLLSYNQITGEYLKKLIAIS